MVSGFSMKSKQIKQTNLLSIYYREFFLAIRNLYEITKYYIEPEVFQNSLIHIHRENFFKNSIEIQNSITLADQAYRRFSTLYRHLYKAGCLSAFDMKYVKSLEKIYPIYKFFKIDLLCIFHQHIEMVEQIDILTFEVNVEKHPISFLQSLEKMLGNDMVLAEAYVYKLFSMITLHKEFDEASSIQFEKLSFSNLKLSVSYIQQIDYWKKETLTPLEESSLNRLADIALYLYQLHTDILMYVRVIKNRIFIRTARMKIYLEKLEAILFS